MKWLTLQSFSPHRNMKKRKEKKLIYENSHFGDARDSGKLWWF